ncbi:sodium-dependent transporter [Gynuella sunshinyii]|uniref:Transporter n=1 Tax=Gynuella sunshinyii YC6258 TaxID=1445510 RepID=A0A0C5W5N5_9GAMM|nr:sodium-dependent transporter [Gynuella sunshinyii]AJQ97919.1 Na+-dependent transporter of the SNF family [Gynuella sunshinyii YC6258]
MSDKKSIHGIWASRWVFIMAATGSAVGLGNIWKFPYITGVNGGGAFVLVYLICVALIGLPILMAEIMVGRRGRQSPVNSLIDVASESNGSTLWQLIGWVGAVAGLLIFGFYSVVAGWILEYAVEMGSGTFNGSNMEQVGNIFNALLADPGKMLIWHTVFTVLTMAIVVKGVNEGLERGVRILMPILFVLLIVAFGYGVSSGHFIDAWHFMFDFEPSKLTAKAVLSALGHAFFTLSLGMGTMIAYGSYMTQKASIGSTALLVVFLDTAVALIAGLAIFPIVFANQMDPGQGPGLMLVTLPVAFGNIALGQLFGTLFFILVGIAAWTSSISLMEPSVAFVVEKFKLNRLQACLILGGLGWILGIGALLSFNKGSDILFFGKNFFDMLDYVTANIMLPLGGLFIALFAGWVVKSRISREEMSVSPLAHQFWLVLVRFIAPILVLIVFIYNLLQ